MAMEVSNTATGRAIKPVFSVLTDKSTELPAAARCLAETFAFVQNPAYRFIFPDTAWCGCQRNDLRSCLFWLFCKRLELLLDCGCPIRTARDSETGEVLAVAAAFSPHRPPTLGQKIMIGLLSWPLRFGFESFRRLFKAEELLGQAPKGAWTLANIACLPSAQGQGLASRLTEMVIEDVIRAEREHRGLTGKKAAEKETVLIHLDTQREVNLRFYGKLGFELVSTTDIDTSSSPDAPSSFRSWIMERRVEL